MLNASPKLVIFFSLYNCCIVLLYISSGLHTPFIFSTSPKRFINSMCVQLVIAIFFNGDLITMLFGGNVISSDVVTKIFSCISFSFQGLKIFIT